MVSKAGKAPRESGDEVSGISVASSVMFVARL